MSEEPSPAYPHLVDGDRLAVMEEIYYLLRPARRQIVILCVAALSPGESLTVRQLAKYTASLEQSIPREEVPNSTYRSVYTGLQDSHLDELAAHNAIRYEDGRVSRAPNTTALTVLLAVTYPIATSLWSSPFSQNNSLNV